MLLGYYLVLRCTMKPWNHRHHETYETMKPLTPRNLRNHETIDTTKPMKPWNHWHHETYETMKLLTPRNLWNHETIDTMRPLKPWLHGTIIIWHRHLHMPLQKRAHWKTSPVKSGVPIRLCEQKRSFKDYRRFRSLMNFIAVNYSHTFKRQCRNNRSRLPLFYVLECLCHCYKEENVYAKRSIFLPRALT